MSITRRSGRQVGLAAMVGVVGAFAATSAHAAPTCSTATKCTVATTAPVKGAITEKLGSVIDSGWMEKGPIKVRTRFAIAPVGSDPVVAVDLPAGATVEASWSEKGFVDLTPLADGAAGAMNVRYTLEPSLEANIYGIGVNYNANELVNKLPGAAFNYDARGTAQIAPWGLTAGEVTMPAPALAQSTIFSLPFSSLGVGSGTATGSLAIQAATKPTFKYQTKELRLGPGSVTEAGASARVAVGDDDAIDVTAYLTGEVSYSGTLDVRPNVKVDSVAGVPTLGLVNFSFSTVTKSYTGTPVSVTMDPVDIHIPLPNVKAPTTPVNLGAVKAGSRATKTITVTNTGEMEGVFTVSSDDAQFTGPAGELRVAPKSEIPVEIAFAPTGSGAAAATITIKSNDPDSPEQTFRIGANGADLEEEATEGDEGGRRRGKTVELQPPPEDSGCSVGARGAGTKGGLVAVAFGLALSALARRRR